MSRRPSNTHRPGVSRAAGSGLRFGMFAVCVSADPDPLLNAGQAVPLYVRLIGFAEVGSRMTGQGYPYRSRLAKAMSCSKQTVDRATNVLECEIGLVSVKRQKLDGQTDENDANLYTLHDGWLIHAVPAPPKTPPQLVARYGHTVPGFDVDAWLAEHAPDFDRAAWQAAYDGRLAEQEAKETEQRRRERARRKPKKQDQPQLSGQEELSSEGGGVMGDATGGVTGDASGGVMGDALLSRAAVQEPTTGTTAPSARSATDARRAGAGSSARGRESGFAAADGAKALNQAARSGRSAGIRGAQLPKEQAMAVAAVEAAWPEALAVLLPKFRPVEITKAILAALDGGRTAEQLAERVRRRWWEHGYAVDAAEGGKGIGSAVGVAVGLVRPPTDCPDPMCEDGARIHVGPRDVCPKCEERRAQRRAGRRQGLVPGPHREAEPTPVWWDCAGARCTATGKGTRPGDGLCWACHDRAEAEEIERAMAGLRAERDAEYCAQAERAKAAAKWALLLDDAYTEYDERETATDAVLRARRAAEVEETRRIREQLVRDHPELAVYAEHPDELAASAPPQGPVHGSGRLADVTRTSGVASQLKADQGGLWGL
ncbi:hypothetical protein ACFYYB_26045 [Streptomyces sp. NPDC002886]|uniref:hypothetical protein n=1 Tax=Streptomyces sp. NPDC002886 TaxID=3364667 RepID=UPI0036BB3032